MVSEIFHEETRTLGNEPYLSKLVITFSQVKFETNTVDPVSVLMM